ncbi:MAG: hypothetical protein LBS21_06935, partial [Clostridiales bacterium]|nr:hypothetical protein [Clostridiales bacterium]
MAYIRHKATLQKLIETGAIVEGQLRFTEDTQRLFWDNDGERIEITDIVELSDETARLAIEKPIDKFYYVISTGELWRAQGGEWKRADYSVLAAIEAETARAKEAELNISAAVSLEETRAKEAENALQSEISAETARATEAESAKY